MKFFMGIFVLFCGALSANLPADFMVCKKNEPNKDKCVQRAIEVAVSRLAMGIKQLDVPPLEPLTIASATIEGGGGPVHLTQKFKNFQINNVISTKVEKYHTSITSTNYTGDMRFYSPEYVIKADYDFDGRILLFPITGKGKCTVTLKNIRLDAHLFGKLYDKKDKKYLDLSIFDIKLYPEKVIFDFENLFNGNQALAAQMNQLLNDNWKGVFDDVKSGYERVLGLVFKNYARMIFNKVSWNDLYP